MNSVGFPWGNIFTLSSRHPYGCPCLGLPCRDAVSVGGLSREHAEQWWKEASPPASQSPSPEKPGVIFARAGKGKLLSAPTSTPTVLPGTLPLQGLQTQMPIEAFEQCT